MIKAYFDNLVKGIENTLANNSSDVISPRKIYALELAHFGSRLYSDTGKIAWCGLTVPFDLLSAMNITSCFVEFVGAMLSSMGSVNDFIKEAEMDGFPGDLCSYHRSIIGATKKEFMPKPDFLIGTTCPCSGGLAVMENLAVHFQKKMFVLNVPQENSTGHINYLANQLKEMVHFISQQTGETLVDDKLQQAIAYTNEARDIMNQVFTLAQSKPSPTDSRLLANVGIAYALLLGTPAAVKIATQYRNYFNQSVIAGQSGVQNETIRLLWIQNRIQFKNNIINILEKDHGAVIVADELNDITWEPIDPKDPYTSMAKRAISIPFNGKGQRRINHLKDMAKRYQVHGAINPCNWGCRQGTGMRGMVEAALKEIDVPVLNLEVDCVDNTNYSEGQLKTRIEAFLEMLTSRL